MKGFAHKSSVTGVRIAGKIGKVLDDSRSKGIEMNVTDEFRQIGVFLAENGFVPILKELAVAAMPFVKRDRMTGKETGHHRVEGDCTGLHQDMGVVTEKRPRVTGSVCLVQYLPHPLDKTVLIDLITEDQSPLDAADDDVVEDAGGVETSMTGHRPMV
jgi:hypothetical protein